MKKRFTHHKPISFKQAGIIVLVLHAFAFLGFTQWSNYKARLAKELREAKKEQLLSSAHSKQDWNNQHIKPKIVAVAPTPKPALAVKETSSLSLANLSSSIQIIITEIIQNVLTKKSENVLTNNTKQQQIFTQKPKQPTTASSPAKPVIVNKLVSAPTPLPKVAKQFLTTKIEQPKRMTPISSPQKAQKREVVPPKPVYTKEVNRTYNSNGTYEQETVEVVVRTRPGANGYSVPVISSNDSQILNEMTLIPVY